MTSLPQITPRNGGGRHGAQRDAADVSAGRDATQESVSDWTPHDVAEWLYLQGTKEDHAHTFLVHNIDGPALLVLTREKLLEWKVKPADCNLILKGVQDLQRIEGGQVGWQPQDDFNGDSPRPPAGSKPLKTTPRRKPGASPPPHRVQVKDGKDSCGTKVEDYSAPAGKANQAPIGDGGEWTTTTMLANMPSGPQRQRSRLTVETAGGQRKAEVPYTPYLRKVMGDIHSDERVPLWKEEMVERVKRVAEGRKQRDPLSHSAPPTARLGRTPRGDDGLAPPSLVESGIGRRLARDGERKVFWYQDAIHEQELQHQLLEQKVNALQSQVQEMLDNQKLKPGLAGVGVVEMEKEMKRRERRELSRLSRNLQVSEERVADAERVNAQMMDMINNLRRGRADFLHHLSKLNEREAAMNADMKHFAQVAHASLDEKEKTDARLKRQMFDYKVEGHHFENVLEGLQAELKALDKRITQAHHAEEQLMQRERQMSFRNLKSKRDAEQKRELKLGYLQNHVRGQEMDFQRLHRIMGVKFTPEKPESVNEIISTSLEHEQRNASLLHFVGVQTAQLEVLQEELRRLSREEEELTARVEQREEAQVVEQQNEERDEKLCQRIEEQMNTYETSLQKLCPIILSLCDVTGALIDPKGDLALKGCRPDTLADHLRLIDISVKDLHTRAAAIPTASGNEWLRDFLQPKAVSEHPNVFDLRKELETAAQKQKEQKAFADASQNGGIDPIMAAASALGISRAPSGKLEISASFARMDVSASGKADLAASTSALPVTGGSASMSALPVTGGSASMSVPTAA